MTNTRIEYFFAFSLTKLELLDDIHLSLDPFTRFRIDILNCNPSLNQLADPLQRPNSSPAHPTSTMKSSSTKSCSFVLGNSVKGASCV